MIVDLAAEATEIERLADLRVASVQADGVKDRKVDRSTDDRALIVEGLTGEAAVRKELGDSLAIPVTRDDDGIDGFIDPARRRYPYQVKFSRHPRAHLILDPDVSRLVATAYVLVTATDEPWVVSLAGVVSRGDVEARRALHKFPWKESYAIGQPGALCEECTGRLDPVDRFLETAKRYRAEMKKGALPGKR